MDIEDQFELGHLFLAQRTCRSCGQTKDLLDGFYLTRKSRGSLPSAYSYECKDCTIKRIVAKRKSKKKNRPRPLPPYLADYPDW